MKRCKKAICILLAVILLSAGGVPVLASGVARSPVGLNGASGKWSEFDASVYALVTDYEHITAEGFVWPSGGAVLVREAASSTTYSINRYKGFTIPAGLVVDFYRYSTVSDTYFMQAHYDTTDGKPYTISVYTTNVGAPDTYNSKLRTVMRTFTPGVPSDSYSNSFTDVDPSAWYYDAVMTMAEGGMFLGYGNGEFGPDDPLTQAQTRIIRQRLLGSDYEDFTGAAPASRAFAAILWSGTTDYGGLIQLDLNEMSYFLRGTDYAPGLAFQIQTFDQETKTYVNELFPGYEPGHTIVRMHRSTYENWIASMNNGKNVTYRYSLNEFPDAAAIRQWFKDNAGLMREAWDMPGYSDDSIISSCEYYLLRAWNLGMVSGVDGEGTFDPYGTMTRAQACQMLYNMGWTYYGCLDYNSFVLAGRYK